MAKEKLIEELTESDYICEDPRRAFTIIPDDLIRSPELTAVAKTVLSIILSNNQGWKTGLSRIKNQMAEGEQDISAAVIQLKEKGYLRKYVVKNSKGQSCSEFYAATHTPNEFDIRGKEEAMNDLGYSIVVEENNQKGE